MDKKQLGFNTQDLGLYSPTMEKDNCGAGFICDLNGRKSNKIIHNALEILVRLTHRGAVSADGKTGDGAGILMKIPHDFFVKDCRKNEIFLPEEGRYAVGMVFLPQDNEQRRRCMGAFKSSVTEEGLNLLGWREVPVNTDALGRIAKETEPKVMQVFVGRGEEDLSEKEFGIRLYISRKAVENEIRESDMCEKNFFYIPSFSTTTIIYKGLIKPEDMSEYYPDLVNEEFVTNLALVHQRFSTNTFPTWDLAQPFRYMCHNGEINTLRGNVNRMRARQELFESELFGDRVEKIKPVVIEGRSDSASLDNAVELMVNTGRSLPEVMMTLVPEAWEKHQDMSDEKKAFYEYASCIMEPWDGPASIPFTDGHCIGAILDRNGLRPSRYTVTKDGLVIMSSEIGVVDVDPSNVEYHGRLEPGRMFLVDMEEGRIVDDAEIKNRVVKSQPYGDWVKDNLIHFDQIPAVEFENKVEETSLIDRKRIFGYSLEDEKIILSAMGEMGKEAIGSMGTDTPLAVLSDKPRLIFDYFKQLFAQVTNPPLDGIREEVVTSLKLTIGSAHNVFVQGGLHCKKLSVETPFLTNGELEKLRSLEQEDLRAVTIPILFKANTGVNGLDQALNEIILKAINAVDAGKTLIILSDRGVNKKNAAIPVLLAASFIHHALTKFGRRSRCGIIVETAEAREIHHFATLFGYGVSAINPYMAYEVLDEMIGKGMLTVDHDKAVANYIKAAGTGLVKVMTKIGISTLHSYRGAQIFEILGLKKDFVDRFFTHTATRIEGADLNEIHKDTVKRHKQAFPTEETAGQIEVNVGGDYQWRRNGERHMFNPHTVSRLQLAVRDNLPQSYEQFAKMINDQSERLMTIRGLMEFRDQNPIPIEEVEPWTEIVKRFKTGAMSYGSISSEAHENLAIAMNRIGGKSNSGEGGENPARFEKDENGDWRRSAIKQVASGRFGVTSHYLTNADEIQIKMAQGAKPGEGGQLPGEKVFPWIAECRNSTPYVGLISPPPHHDIYSIEDLAQLIYDLKNANRAARVNVKLVSEVGVGTIAAGVAKAKADVILVSGFDGGTGASPLTSLKHCGLPWELGIAEAQQTLVMNDLRNRIVLECDGQLKTGRDVAIAALLGAEEFGFATAPLVASGCIMMRVCHLNTCPVGIATQDPELRKRFKGKPEHVVNYMRFVAEELRQIMSELGFRTIAEMVGKSEKIEMRKAIDHYKAQGLDYSKILYKPELAEGTKLFNTEVQDHELDDVIDFTLLEKSKAAIENKEKVSFEINTCNTDRSVGAILSNEISKIYGKEGLPEDTIDMTFHGSAGQSFGAFSTKGLTMRVEGETNDYLGKGLSGAKLIIKPAKTSTYVAKDNIITGNVTLYGAVTGEAYINGIAGERFCVRNSGAKAVVEGVGDHGCEYMTGGVAVILGETGRNFAAGMSGGVAYVLDPTDKFKKLNCNMEMIGFEKVEVEADVNELKQLITNHFNYTNSPVAEDILNNWDAKVGEFVKVMPHDYKRALERIAREKEEAAQV